MKNDIEKIMSELVKGSDRIIVNPETLEELRKRGIPFNIIPSPTIDELFDQRKKKLTKKRLTSQNFPKDCRRPYGHYIRKYESAYFSD